MKELTAAVLLLTLSACAYERKEIDQSFRRPDVMRVAALPVAETSNGSQMDVTFAVAGEFLKAGWKVVDRSIIDKILAEQQFQTTGAVEKNAVEIGRLSGARFVTTGSGGRRVDQQGYLYLRLVDVETGEIVASANCIGNVKLGPCAAKKLAKIVNDSAK